MKEFDKDKQKEFDKRYLMMAKIWGENSYAIKRKVGCLIVKDNMIISDGYNGTPSGFENICEYIVLPDGKKMRYGVDAEDLRTHFEELIKDEQYKDAKLMTKSYVLHAEANAITKLARSSHNADGATLYCTDEPCINCAKLIIQSGIKRVVYMNDYHTHDGLALLKKSKIEIVKLSD